MTNQTLGLYSNFATNLSNPFYIHPNENPAVTLIQQQLEGGMNFQYWVHLMCVAIISKKKMIFVDGTTTTPEKTNVLYIQWFRCNNMVLAWIQRSVNTNILTSIMFFDKGNDAWKDLKDKFDQGDIFKIANLLEDLCKVTQGPRDIFDCFTKFKALWDEWFHAHVARFNP